MNINLLNSYANKDTEDFVNTLSSYAFQPHILRPTRITNHSATLIDHIFFNSCEHHTISGNVAYDLTDHLPNFLIINKLTDLPRGYKAQFKRRISHVPNKMSPLNACDMRRLNQLNSTDLN